MVLAAAHFSTTSAHANRHQAPFAASRTIWFTGSPRFQCNNWRYANPALARGWCW